VNHGLLGYVGPGKTGNSEQTGTAVLEDFVSQNEQVHAANHLAAQGVDRLQDSDPSTRPDRRTVIRHVGVGGLAVLGAATLSACGGGKGTANQSGGAASSAGPGKEVVKAADIPVGSGTVFAAAKVVVTQPRAGDFKAFSAICTHMGCTVAGVVNGMITCPCHGSTYDMTTGQVTGGPAPAPLPSKTVTVSGGSVTIS